LKLQIIVHLILEFPKEIFARIMPRTASIDPQGLASEWKKYQQQTDKMLTMAAISG
jgi:hypothetical protein